MTFVGIERAPEVRLVGEWEPYEGVFFIDVSMVRENPFILNAPYHNDPLPGTGENDPVDVREPDGRNSSE